MKITIGRRRAGLLLLGMLGASVLAGCTSVGPTGADASAVIARFEGALSTSDPAMAGAQPSPRTATAIETQTGQDCESSILDLSLQQLNSLEAPLSWGEYLLAPDFWNRTLQNWQSEFLAVGSMAVLSIYLRERGSPESKAVGEAHDAP